MPERYAVRKHDAPFPIRPAGQRGGSPRSGGRIGKVAWQGKGVEVDHRAGAVVSFVLAPLVDGPRQELTVVHRTSSVEQLADRDGRVVACITSPGSLRLPHAIAVARPPRTTSSIFVGDGVLDREHQRIPVARWWRPARPNQPSLRARVRDDVAEACVRRWRRTIGLGDGLTPYDDDVLCGTLATLQAARHPQAVHLSHGIAAAPLEDLTTAASAGLLRQAAAWWCLDEVAAVLTALVTGLGLPEAEAALHRIGHSSGRGLSEGIDRVLRTTVRRATA